MLTLGNKEVIVNDPSYIDLTVTGDRCEIKNYGIFDNSKIKSAWGQRYMEEEKSTLTLKCPTADEIGLVSTDKRKSVIVHIDIATQRSNVDSPVGPATAGNPLRVELILDGTDDSPTIATKLIEALDNYDSEFGPGTLPFTWSQQTSGNLVYLNSNSGSFYFTGRVFFITEFAIRLRAETILAQLAYDDTTPVTLTVAALTDDTTITVSSTAAFNVGDVIYISTGTFAFGEGVTVEAIVDGITLTVSALDQDYAIDSQIFLHVSPMEAFVTGKWLEENVLMGTVDNSVPYAIAAGEYPALSTKYTTISFEIEGDNDSSMQGSGYYRQHDMLNSSAPSAVTPATSQIFTLYFDEDTCLESGGPVSLLVAWLGASANVTLSDSFVIADKSTATTSGEFIA